jgi:protoporphyrinogen oxidase
VDANIETLPPGWVSLKKDPASNKIIWRENKSKHADPVEKSENELATEALDALVELYDMRDEEYIDTWGYEDWERTFRFPNYDYEYFDRLDELADEELEVEENNQDEWNELDYNDSSDRWN